jgi:hypothetical protein
MRFGAGYEKTDITDPGALGIVGAIVPGQGMIEAMTGRARSFG